MVVDVENASQLFVTLWPVVLLHREADLRCQEVEVLAIRPAVMMSTMSWKNVHAVCCRLHDALDGTFVDVGHQERSRVTVVRLERMLVQPPSLTSVASGSMWSLCSCFAMPNLRLEYAHVMQLRLMCLRCGPTLSPLFRYFHCSAATIFLSRSAFGRLQTA